MSDYKRLPLTNDGKLIESGFKLKSPRNLIIVKYPKSGGTLSMCDVPKILILDAEDGTDYFTARNVSKLIDKKLAGEFVFLKKYGYIPKTIFEVVDELNTANNMEAYWDKYNELENERDFSKKEGIYNEVLAMINAMPFPIVAIDTITSITDLSNQAALYEYNQGVKESSQKVDIKRADEYGGVQYIRRKFSEIKRFIEENAAPFIQYHGHVAFKKQTLKKNEEQMTALDIALEGLLSYSFTAKADAVCSMYRDKDGVWMDFNKQQETDLGSRPQHLANKKIKIADIMKPGETLPKNYWSTIYPEVNFS